MNTDQDKKNSEARPPLRRRKSKTGRNVAIMVILVLLGAMSAWAVWGTGQTGGWARSLWEEDKGLDDSKVYVVTRGPLTISITQNGTIHHRNKVIVKSKLEGYSTVIWLIDEGEQVNVGDLLLEMDSTDFEQKKELQEITVINSEADLVSATEALAVTRNNAETAVVDATLAIHLAELDLMKYVGRTCYENYQHIREQLAKAQAMILSHEDHAEQARQLKAQLAKDSAVTLDDPQQAKDHAERIEQLKAQLTKADQVVADDAKTAKDDAALVLDLEQQRKKALALVVAVIEAKPAADDTEQAAALTEEQREAEDERKAEKERKQIVALAKKALAKYVGGEFYQQLKEAQAAITIAEEELTRARDYLGWSIKLHAKKIVTKTELEGDELKVTQAKLKLSTTTSKLAVLVNYSHLKSLAELENSLGKAERALDPIKRKADADIKQAEAKLTANQSEHKQQLALRAKYSVQIKECRVYAPVAGQVVYATTTSGGRHGRDIEQLDKGSSVRERQELFHMPNEDQKMMAVIKIPQAAQPMLANPDKSLRNLPARVTIAGTKDKYFPATLAKMAPLPYHDWVQSIKVFNTEVHVDDVSPELRPGYTCKVEIIIAQYEDVISVPLQTVQLVRGKPTVYVVTDRGAVPRVVEVGMDNNRLVHIKSGLEEGERVLLAPPFDETEADPSGKSNGRRKARTTTTKPAGGRGGKGQGSMGSMTPEQRKKAYEKMTPEQKAALRKRMKQRQDEGKGKPAGGGRPKR